MSEPNEPNHHADAELVTRSTEAEHSDMIEHLREHALMWFTERPSRRSMLLAMAQFWDDGADDEVHAWIVGSTRDTPVWPHECAMNAYPDSCDLDAVFPGEECGNCKLSTDGSRGPDYDNYFRFCGEDGDSRVLAFELFCREDSHQEQTFGQAYVPFAIARRRDASLNGSSESVSEEEIDIELVGRPQRPANEVIGTAEQPLSRWDTPQLRALYDQTCRSARDDSTRHVLSDLLLETRPSDPRGELIALSLAGELRPSDRKRRDALIADHLAALIHPLGTVVPPGCARFERGFLVEADVFAVNDEAQGAVKGAAAWGTVEVLRIAPGSEDLLDPAMRALRDVGPLGEFGLLQLCCAPEPWAIERLHVDTNGIAAGLNDLVRTPLLPRLRYLVLTGSDATLRPLFDAFSSALWWPQLERITLVVDTLAAAPGWRALRPAHAWLAISEAADDRQPAGWELAFGPDGTIEIAMVRWHSNGTMKGLAELVAGLPRDETLHLRSTRYRALGDEELAYLNKQVPHQIVLA